MMKDMVNLSEMLGTEIESPENLPEIKPMSPESFEQMMVDIENREEGNLPDFDCKECRNRGYIVRLVNRERILRECKCMKIRRTICCLKEIGLGAELEKCRFSSFTIDGKAWRENMLNVCKDFVEHGGNSWLYLGGQSRSGKTHLCTAVCRHLLGKGLDVKYLLWDSQIFHKLEALRLKYDEYDEYMKELCNYDVLYIDDFLKTATENSSMTGFVDKPDIPSGAEMKMAKEVINMRTISKKKTIISSEHFLEEVTSYDSATGGRIQEMTENGRFAVSISRDSSRKYGLK